MYKMLSILVLLGCGHTRPAYVPPCPAPIIVYGVYPEPEYDAGIIAGVYVGCRRTYGEYACPSKIYKLGVRNWYVECK